MNKVESITLFSNGNTAVFDINGEQIPELQKGWLNIWLEWLENKGINPMKISEIRTVVNGKNCLLKPFKTENGWNCKIITE